MTSPRKVAESPVLQGAKEKIIYSFDFSTWVPVGSDGPTSPLCTLFDLSHNRDVSASKLEGSPELVGNIVNTPRVISLVTGVRYRLECLVTIGDNDESMYCEIEGE